MEKERKIKWDKIPNSKIKEELLSLNHQHIALKLKIDKLLDNLDEIEKEYYYGNKILIKRYKGDSNE